MQNRTMVVLISLLIFAVLLHAESLVEISIEVAEVNNSKARDLGIKWIDEIQTGEVSLAANQGAPKRLPEYLPDLSSDNSLPSIIKIGEWQRFSPLTADLRILVQKGAAKIMSKPKLLTKSGTTAKFMVGGELPIVATGVSGGTIQWKEFGIILKVKPIILSDSQINLDINTEVSRLDWINAVAGVPALATRTVSSEVDLKSGETITIAGLVETKKQTNKIGIPVLMDIPLLGILFSRHVVNDIETTVMIFATPKIIK